MALLFFSLMFIAFMAAEKSREINAWLILLGSMVLWALGSVFMRMNIYPGIDFWFYVSLLALFTIPFFVYNFVYLFANESGRSSRIIWLAGTVIILAIASTGTFLAPPEMSQNASGKTVFTYVIDWKVGIPTAFFIMEITAIGLLLKQIIKEKGRGAPGVMELIIGCVFLAVGNIVQVLPGNTFPFDTLSGILFAMLIVLSLYKRRMFDTTLIMSGSILVVLSAGLLVAAGAYFFPAVNSLLQNNGGNLAPAEVETFIILAVVLIMAISAFRKLLNAIFSEQEHQSVLIKKYSDYISKTLDIDSILRETIKVIRNELHINEMYICLLKDDKFVPVCSSMPLKPVSFRISRNHPCVKYFEQGENNIVLREFEGNPLYKSMWSSEKELFSEYGITCVCALKDADSVVGLLLLSDKEKSSGYDYSDFSYINTVSSIASIAIKNAALYKRVAEREHLFSSMTKFIPNVIFIKSKYEDGLSFVSANTDRVLGIPAEYFAERTAKEAITECLGEEKAEEIHTSLVERGEEGYFCDIPFVTHSDHREITIRCAFLPIVSDCVVSHYVCVVNDITADIQAQALLKASVELAQNSNKAKSEFLSHMSHEIRTPMNSIAGLTYLAREYAGHDTQPELCGYLDQIDQSSQYLISMLNNIMDISKIESNKYELHDDEFDITDVINEVYSVYGTQMAAKKVDFSLDAEGLIQSRVTGDEISLRKILNNLLSNAYKFTPSGGSVSLSVSQKMRSEKATVVSIVVRDTGIGISKEFIGRLFEPYSQEITVNGSKATGSGLGMAICKSMIDLQGGTIGVESEVGEGTSFTVEIPYALAARKTESENTNEIDCTSLYGKRIMVVDDVAINTVITRRLLEKQNVLVDCAENGQTALELFESKPDHYYDCILMDIQMPVMDGIEAAAQIRGVKKRYAAIVPIIAMTADAFLNENHNGALDDFNGYILKPVSPDGLYGKLASLLNE